MYGIQVKNSSGNLLLDSIYKNFSKYASGTTTIVAGINTISFTATTQIPLIAVRPATGNQAVLWGYKKTGSDFDGFYIIATPGDLEWIVYLAHPAATSDKYGMRSYDAAGNLLFDSNQEYFNIYQANTGISLSSPTNTDEAAGTYSDVTHAGTSNPYYILSPLGFWIFGVEPPSGILRIWRTGIKKIDATTCRVKWCMIKGGATGQSYNEGWNPNLNLLVLK